VEVEATVEEVTVEEATAEEGAIVAEEVTTKEVMVVVTSRVAMEEVATNKVATESNLVDTMGGRVMERISSHFSGRLPPTDLLFSLSFFSLSFEGSRTNRYCTLYLSVLRLGCIF
jgi:hypothetical protein